MDVLLTKVINGSKPLSDYMNWIWLVIAGFFEVGFTFSLGKAKEVSGSSASYFWYAIFIICLFASMGLLIHALKTIPIGTAYAIWTGIGAVGTVLVGIFIFKEPAEFWRLFFVTTLIGSVIGLKFVSH
ncbi:multidrug efflux SMR transporter [Dysgonomonas capnocytophagoides]|nr:multidrug efflux SMR transporter [Dysgonomonas capnocytophagoides]